MSEQPTTATIDYLSDEWMARFGELLAGHTGPVTNGDVESLTIGFIVEADDVGPGAAYRVTVDGGMLGLVVDEDEGATRAGADVVMISTRTTAASIARRDRSALDAFMTGDLRLDGETTRLLEARESLVDLADLTGELRTATRF